MDALLRTAEYLGTEPQGLRTQSASDGVVIIDDRGIIERINPVVECLFGYQAGEVIGRSISMLMPGPDREDHLLYVRRYRDGSVPRMLGAGRRVMGKRKDGTVFPMYLSLSEVVLGDRPFFAGIMHALNE